MGGTAVPRRWYYVTFDNTYENLRLVAVLHSQRYLPVDNKAESRREWSTQFGITTAGYCRPECLPSSWSGVRAGDARQSLRLRGGLSFDDCAERLRRRKAVLLRLPRRVDRVSAHKRSAVTGGYPKLALVKSFRSIMGQAGNSRAHFTAIMAC